MGGPRDLVTTDYGRLVLLKIGLFVAMVGIATANRFHFTPLLPAPGALRALQRNSLAEAGLGLCALVFVGTLGTLSPSGHAHSTNAEVPPDAAFVHIHTDVAMAEVTIEPGRAGPANAHIRVLREISRSSRQSRSSFRSSRRLPAPRSCARRHICRTGIGR